MKRILRNIGKPHLLALVLLFGLLLASSSIIAKPISPPKDPSQSITYWKSQVIDPESSADIALAHSVFDVLLRTWDTARVEPNLYVVNSSAGPWAASLADGNILLSQSAIEVCKNYGKQYAEHLLAFILGHELAHQRAEDLWHQKFLRLAGSQAPEIQAQLLRDLQINPDSITQLESREAQADHDGLLIMSSVGYDPFKVVDHKDFFTTWVENLWQVSCSTQNLDKQITHACKKAQTRALRTRAQLTTVATQNTLFQLGIQAYVAGNYPQARHFFSAFGKEYPSAAIFTNIGLTYLQQAIVTDNEISDLDPQQTNFLYPLTLAQNPFPGDTQLSLAPSNKRGATDVLIAQLRSKKHDFLENAIAQFEKAIRLQPANKHNYVLLASSYLVDDNIFMSRGIMQGKYIPKFGEDTESRNVLAITQFKEKNYTESIKLFASALSATARQAKKSTPMLATHALDYVTSFNLASVNSYLGKHSEEIKVWKNLANRANKSGDGYLFQMAVYHINDNAAPNTNNKRSVRVKYDLNTRHKDNAGKSDNAKELWLDGKKYLLVADKKGNRKIVNDKNNIIATSNVYSIRKRSKNNDASNDASNMVAIGDSADRPLKLFGIPTRNIQLSSGNYLAYDDLSLAIHIINDTIVDWFLYDKDNSNFSDL